MIEYEKNFKCFIGIFDACLSLFCANAAFGEDGSSKNGKNTFQSAENLVIGTIYNRPATEITGTVFKLDLNQAAKYTL